MRTNRTSRVCGLAAAFFSVGLSAAAAAPGQISVSPGDRIRITFQDSDLDRIKGEVVEVGGGTLRLSSDDGDPYSLGQAEIRALEISTGKNRLAGTLVGLVTGALFGGLIGSRIERATSDHCFDSCGLGGFLMGFGIGGLGAGVAGYAFLGSDRWQEIDAPYSLGSRSPEIRFQISL